MIYLRHSEYLVLTKRKIGELLKQAFINIFRLEKIETLDLESTDLGSIKELLLFKHNQGKFRNYLKHENSNPLDHRPKKKPKAQNEPNTEKKTVITQEDANDRREIESEVVKEFGDYELILDIFKFKVCLEIFIIFN